MSTPISAGTIPIIYNIDFIPDEPDALLLRSTGPIPNNLGPVHLYYGQGLNPYSNIIDEKDWVLVSRRTYSHYTNG